MALQKPVLWIALGNPYVLKLFPQVPAYLCTFSYSDGSQLAAARAMSGEIAVSGKTPVSIPGYFAVGDGLQVPKLELTLRPGTESPDLRPDTFDETRRLLASYVSQGAFPGGALAVGFRGALVLDAAAGKLDTTPENEVTGDTMYDLASLSKVIGTTSAAMMLFDSERNGAARPKETLWDRHSRSACPYHPAAQAPLSPHLVTRGVPNSYTRCSPMTWSTP